MGKKAFSLFLTSLGEIVYRLKRQELLTGKVIMNQQQLAAQLTANAAQVEKIKGEVQNLLVIISNQAEVSPELQAAADSLGTALQGLDDVNPDPVLAPEEVA